MRTRNRLQTGLILSVLFSTLVWLSAQASSDVEFDSVRIQINDIKLELEYAQQFEQRARGLMFRKSLCEDCGMLFRFEPEKQASMWMKNTFIPLDVAFIDRNGVITDIKALHPHASLSCGVALPRIRRAIPPLRMAGGLDCLTIRYSRSVDITRNT